MPPLCPNFKNGIRCNFHVAFNIQDSAKSWGLLSLSFSNVNITRLSDTKLLIGTLVSARQVTWDCSEPVRPTMCLVFFFYVYKCSPQPPQLSHPIGVPRWHPSYPRRQACQRVEDPREEDHCALCRQSEAGGHRSDRRGVGVLWNGPCKSSPMCVLSLSVCAVCVLSLFTELEYIVRIKVAEKNPVTGLLYCPPSSFI